MRQVILDVSEFQTPNQLNELLSASSAGKFCTDEIDEKIVGVYIKLTQDIHYRNQLAGIFAEICKHHGIPFGYYDYLTNNQQMIYEYKWFQISASLAPEYSLFPMLDCEGGILEEGSKAPLHWIGGSMHPAIIYASLSAMPAYMRTNLPLWVAQYNLSSPSFAHATKLDEILNYQLRYTLWQFTEHYAEMNQDASILLVDSINKLHV